MKIIKVNNPPVETEATVAKPAVKKTSTTKKSTAKKTTVTKTVAKKSTASKAVKPAVKLVTPEEIKKICQALGLKSFSRPFAGLIDQGDFGTVATYIPLYAGELDKLPKDLKEDAYEIAEGRFGLICRLPRTFEAPDGGKVVSMVEYHDKKGNVIKADYTTDAGNTMTASHELRLAKLFTYVKNKKLPIKVEKLD